MTEIVFILDRSGSMRGLESDTIGGFNATIDRQKEETDGDALVSTVLFNHESFVLLDRIPLAEVEPLTEKDYRVGGTTALLDAVGEAVKHIKNIHKYARAEDRPQKTLFVITTDGMENASYKFDYKEIKRLIEQQKEIGWEFIFMGANIDAVEVASHIGIDARRAVNYHADKIGTRKAYGAMSNFMSAFAAAPMSNFFDDSSWREEIDKDFEDRNKDEK
ncbi:MAG: VWA domain-containing protein [Selenomonadaceae bacterium]|nr:VWA domain-containing protein [Selenomonadaceae bacterium]